MSEIKSFTETILSRKEAEYEQKLNLAKTEQEIYLAEQLDKINLEHALNKEKIDMMIETREHIEKQKIDNHMRNQLLSHRQNLLEDIFTSALSEMTSWDKERFESFLDRVVRQLDSEKNYRLILGEKSQSFNQLKLPDYVTLSDETIPNESGFMLEVGGIQYNYLFSAIISELKQDFIGQLSHRI